MIDIKQYIESGIIELYVFGALSEAKSLEVSANVAAHPKLLKEVEHIEKSMLIFSESLAPGQPMSFSDFKKYLLANDVSVRQLSRKRTTSSKYLGWAAGFIMLLGLSYFYLQNSGLKNQITDLENKQELQESTSKIIEEKLASTQKLLDVVRSKDVIPVSLDGQEIALDAYATVYWDKSKQKAYVDVKGLPAPPEGEVYQVWSLTLDPLTPTNLGVIGQSGQSVANVFEFDNPNQSQAFGITLEPNGGSDSPTLEKLYVLGTVAP